jgi:Cro/C1-type HTH DNA-binding domain
MEIRLRVRYTLRDPALLSTLMDHPGRGTPYSTRTLAEAVGCHHSQVHRLLTGQQETVDMDLAHALTKALGVAILVLFAPPASPVPTGTATE